MAYYTNAARALTASSIPPVQFLTSHYVRVGSHKNGKPFRSNMRIFYYESYDAWAGINLPPLAKGVVVGAKSVFMVTLLNTPLAAVTDTNHVIMLVNDSKYTSFLMSLSQATDKAVPLYYARINGRTRFIHAGMSKFIARYVDGQVGTSSPSPRPVFTGSQAEWRDKQLTEVEATVQDALQQRGVSRHYNERAPGLPYTWITRFYTEYQPGLVFGPDGSCLNDPGPFDHNRGYVVDKERAAEWRAKFKSYRNAIRAMGRLDVLQPMAKRAMDTHPARCVTRTEPIEQVLLEDITNGHPSERVLLHLLWRASVTNRNRYLGWDQITSEYFAQRILAMLSGHSFQLRLKFGALV